MPLTLCAGGGLQYSVASTLDSIPSNECWTLLLNLKNAFNNIFIETQPIYHPLECGYGSQNNLHLGETEAVVVTNKATFGLLSHCTQWWTGSS